MRQQMVDSLRLLLNAKPLRDVAVPSAVPGEYAHKVVWQGTQDGSLPLALSGFGETPVDAQHTAMENMFLMVSNAASAVKDGASHLTLAAISELRVRHNTVINGQVAARPQIEACGNCRGRSGSLSGIMQIVTSAVRVDLALTLSRRCSLFASAKFVFVWNTGRFSSTLLHRVLCAAGTCSLSVLWWLDQFTAPSKGTTAFSGLMRLRSSSCATSSIVTNRSRDSSVEICDCDDDRDRC